jgi:hypothetical protein
MLSIAVDPRDTGCVRTASAAHDERLCKQLPQSPQLLCRACSFTEHDASETTHYSPLFVSAFDFGVGLPRLNAESPGSDARRCCALFWTRRRWDPAGADTFFEQEGSLQVIALSFEPVDTVKAYIRENRVDVDAVAGLEGSGIETLATPTVVLINSDRLVDRSWVGQLAPSQEQEVVEWVRAVTGLNVQT